MTSFPPAMTRPFQEPCPLQERGPFQEPRPPVLAAWRSGGHLRLVCLLLLAGFFAGAQAEPTMVELRVLSQGAKFIGDGTGGARVRLFNVETGAELANGITRGGTGDTARIMESCGREPVIATADAASFRTVLEIDAPMRVRAEVEGPLAMPQASTRASAERWLLPGLGTGGGDGWVLELPGVAVSLRQPEDNARLALAADGLVDVVGEVMMLCGCPLSPGGLWDTNDQQVAVSALGPGGVRLGPFPLQYAGEPNRFSGRLPLATPGTWELTLSAFNVRTGATGVARSSLRIHTLPEM